MTPARSIRTALVDTMRLAALGLTAALASCAQAAQPPAPAPRAPNPQPPATLRGPAPPAPATQASASRTPCRRAADDHLWPVRYLTVAIHRPPAVVYAYAANPENLPHWAAGLARGSIERDGDDWLATAPMGRVRIRFAPDNPFGVLDHHVTLPDGTTIDNPMHVIPNADGSEVVFVLFRRPGVSDAEFARDTAAVERDLAALKCELER